MGNSSGLAIEDYNEKLFPVMVHKPPTQRSSLTQYTQCYFAVNPYPSNVENRVSS